MKIRLARDLQPDSIVDGEGIRTVIWTQGCIHNCPFCHNPETHSFDGGILVDTSRIKEVLKEIKGQTGITFSGGDPMAQPKECTEIAKYAKEIGLNVWCYTGYTYEKLLTMGEDYTNFLKYIDVLVDGPFLIKEKSFDVKFRGSKNQRLIDVKKTLNNNEVVLYDEEVKQETKKRRMYI